MVRCRWDFRLGWTITGVGNVLIEIGTHSPESYECGSYKILLTERAPDEDGWVRHACLLNSGWRAHTVFRTLPPSYLTSASASVRTIAVTKPCKLISQPRYHLIRSWC